jgi:hypothetical protein
LAEAVSRSKPRSIAKPIVRKVPVPGPKNRSYPPIRSPAKNDRRSSERRERSPRSFGVVAGEGPDCKSRTSRSRAGRTPFARREFVAPTSGLRHSGLALAFLPARGARRSLPVRSPPPPARLGGGTGRWPGRGSEWASSGESAPNRKRSRRAEPAREPPRQETPPATAGAQLQEVRSCVLQAPVPCGIWIPFELAP